ncbi:hypothetical protein MHTCC0001_35160 [Flavobacteriaceae bacterium MHTCC 0001]
MDNRNYGYINSVGEVIIDPIFSFALDFSEGLAAIREKGYYGYIDKTGKLVIPPNFEDADKFKNGMAIVKTKDNKEVYINTKGQIIEVKLEQYYELNNFNEGMSLVRAKNGFGYINTKGNVVVIPQYKSAGNFENGLALVSKNGSNFGYINKSGEYIIEPKYYLATDFSNGIAAVKDSADKTKFINTEGKIVLEINSSYTCDNFSDDGLAVFYEEGKGYGYVDKNGKIVIKPDKRFKVLGSFYDGIAFFSTEKAIGYIDKNGEILFSIDKEFGLKKVSNGMIPFYKRDNLGKIKYGFMNTKGEIKIKPKFRAIEPFKGNIARVYLPEAFSDYLYINRNGDIIEPKKKY